MHTQHSPTHLLHQSEDKHHPLVLLIKLSSRIWKHHMYLFHTLYSSPTLLDSPCQKKKDFTRFTDMLWQLDKKCESTLRVRKHLFSHFKVSCQNLNTKQKQLNFYMLLLVYINEFQALQIMAQQKSQNAEPHNEMYLIQTRIFQETSSFKTAKIFFPLKHTVYPHFLLSNYS